MTRSRSRIVAAQAVVVGVLMVIVFLTLLQPEGSAPLFGVSAPGRPQHVVQHPADDHGGENGGHGDGRERDVQAGEIQGGAPGETVGPGAGAPPSSAPGVEPTPGTGVAPESPAGDQYTDMLTKLAARLN